MTENIFKKNDDLMCPELEEEFDECEENAKKTTLEDLSEEDKEYIIRRLLGVRHEGDYFVLLWKKLPMRPREASYVLVKQWDPEDGMLCIDACYENGRFWYRYDMEDQMEIEEKSIRGWDYYPYSQLTESEKEHQEILEFLRELKEKYPFPKEKCDLP